MLFSQFVKNDQRTSSSLGKRTTTGSIDKVDFINDEGRVVEHVDENRSSGERYDESGYRDTPPSDDDFFDERYETDSDEFDEDIDERSRSGSAY